MRTAILAVAISLCASAAFAAPAMVSVSVGPELQAKAVKTYGVPEVERLAADLRREVEKKLARTGAYDDTRVDLVLVDAVPNRPTFKQLSDTPGLSLQSFGVGGAEIAGTVTRADGSTQPLGYRWYESDIRWAYANWIWSDAETTFDRFATRLSRGEAVASR